MLRRVWERLGVGSWASTWSVDGCPRGEGVGRRMVGHWVGRRMVGYCVEMYMCRWMWVL